MSRVCATRQSSSYVSGAHRKRIAQVQVVNVGRARASNWSGSAGTGRDLDGSASPLRATTAAFGGLH